MVAQFSGTRLGPLIIIVKKYRFFHQPTNSRQGPTSSLLNTYVRKPSYNRGNIHGIPTQSKKYVPIILNYSAQEHPFQNRPLFNVSLITLNRKGYKQCTNVQSQVKENCTLPTYEAIDSKFSPQIKNS